MVDAATLDLSRAQFAFTVSFHILFPTLTIGLAGFLVALEAFWLRTSHVIYLQLYKFWVRIFALTFGVGVVSGLVLSFEFGTNFAEFAYATAPVLGPLLAMEVLTAFFVEAGFLGVMIFGWNRVGPKLHFVATLLVFLGTLTSAFWILAANSWMQTPAGAVFHAGQFVVVDWPKVIFNPSFPYRLAHMLVASFLTTAFIVAGISAFFVLKSPSSEAGRRGLTLALYAAIVLAPLQVLLGDLHGQQVKRDQPIKVAAMEALWQTRKGAPFVVFAVPDQAARENRHEIAIPYGASLILEHRPDGKVWGLNEVPPEDAPPVAVVFYAFRLMLACGFAMLGLAIAGIVFKFKKVLFERKWYLRALVAALPLGHLATLSGWAVAEAGRQPWTVYGAMRTADSVSPVPAGSVSSSLTLFILAYGAVLATYLYYVAMMVRRGPLDEQLAATPEAMQGGAPRYVVPDS